MTDSKRPITVALAGNPNAGKTTIFNNLTGARQHVGNWPGVTVEKKEGTCRQDGRELSIVDLPGTYSLTAYSLEEVVVRDFIAAEKPDVVVDIADAGNLERNLYLTTQLMELGVPVILGLNMTDNASKRGIDINLELLSELLGVPVVPMVGLRNQGTDKLKETIVSAVSGDVKFRDVNVNYGREPEEEIEKLEKVIRSDKGITEKFLGKYSPRWLAIKLLEEDPKIEEDIIAYAADDSPILSAVEASRHHLSTIFGEDIETIIVDNRFGFVSGVVREAVHREREEYETVSDRIDNILTHRIFGFPFFALFMWLMFFLTFFLGKYPMAWIDWVVTNLADLASHVITSPAWLQSFIVDGVIGGVGAVLVFMPQIFIMFLCISLLEDTGYMARAAFIMDRIMHWLGLHGKSFIPMVMGFGCNVPAVMATRTLESEKDRIITILINPFMSCTARLPVYALFTAAFFAGNQGTVTFSIYLMGIILAVVSAKLFRKFLFPGESEPFVMELPPYRWPTAKGTFIHMWDRASMFLRKAGTVILAGSIVIWFLSYFPTGVEYGGTGSLAGMLGRILEPVFKPLGFDWRAAVALLFGIIAKEIVVSTYGTLLGAGEGQAISSKLQEIFTPLTAYGFMAFTLIYTPCLATVAVIRKETGSWKWAAFSMSYSFALAWLMAFTIYRLGSILGIGG
ncbi:MAG: ferrous iron transport protein B [Actinobacteria bacterium]|nr:ferrous iron transport protein B [Actinomycetota bacterium]